MSAKEEVETLAEEIKHTGCLTLVQKEKLIKVFTLYDRAEAIIAVLKFLAWVMGAIAGIVLSWRVIVNGIAASGVVG